MKRGRGGGCRKTLGKPMALRAQRPSRQHPLTLAKVLPDLEAADNSGPRSGSHRSHSPGVPTWEASAAALVTGITTGTPCAEATRPRSCSSRLSLDTVQGAGAQATPMRGSGLGTLLRVNAPFRDSGERPPRAGCPDTSESHGDRYQVQSGTQSWEKKAATDGKMAGSATTYAGLKARLFLADCMSDWVAFSQVPLIGWRFRSHPE